MDIRFAKPDEATQLTRIAFAAKRYWGYPETDIALWQDDLTITPEFIDQNDVFVAIQNNTVAGFCALSNGDSVREVEHFWIDPQYIGKGIGRKWFQHIRQAMEVAKIAKLRITSDPNAVGFYKKMGAKVIDRAASTPPGRFLPLMEVHVR